MRLYHPRMRKAKRRALAFLLGMACVAALAQAQTYPNHGLRLVVDTSPGGLTDLLGRFTADALTQAFSQTVVVENKPGASGNVAIDYVVRSPTDGYTLIICSGGGLVVKPFLEKGLAFDVMNDLVPVFNVAEASHILVVPASLPVKDLAEFIAYARAQPGDVYYASAGMGSPPHLSMELFAKLAGAPMVHVPYKGVGGAMGDLLAGRVHAMSMSVGSARPYLRNGQL